MEQCDLLDQLNEKHIYALHYIFIPRINKALNLFMRGWNRHSIWTAHNKSPHQLFTAGMLLLRHSWLIALDFFDNVDIRSWQLEVDIMVLMRMDLYPLVMMSLWYKFLNVLALWVMLILLCCNTPLIHSHLPMSTASIYMNRLYNFLTICKYVHMHYIVITLIRQIIFT